MAKKTIMLETSVQIDKLEQLLGTFLALSIYSHRPIYKIIGGFHLLNLDDKKLEWTAKKMEESGVKYFVGAHCTGVNSTYSIRDYMKLSKNNALVGSVGTYITKDGIYPGYMQ